MSNPRPVPPVSVQNDLHYFARATMFGRPTDTTQYAADDLIANSTTAGSVVPLSFTVNTLGSGRPMDILGATISKSTNTKTAASFMLDLFSALPTVTNGDNGAYSVATNADTYLGSVAIDMSTVGSTGVIPADNKLNAVAMSATPLRINGPTATTIYGLLRAVGAYAPGNAENFTVGICYRPR